MPGRIADLINEQNVIGWFQGEWNLVLELLVGGHYWNSARETQKTINLKSNIEKVFVHLPSIRKTEYFGYRSSSPYMLLVADVKKDKQTPMTKKQILFWTKKIKYCQI